MFDIEIVNALNDYSFSGERERILKLLNTLFDSKEYKEHLQLVFTAISITEMYGFVSYLDDEEKKQFLEWDELRSNSYAGKAIPFYNNGQLSLLYEVEEQKKVFFSAPTSFGKTSLLVDYIISKSESLSNVLMIVPTNSLLEELYIKMIKNNSMFELGYYVTTQPYYKVGVRNFLILTPERFLLLFETVPMDSFDITIMDETYKIVDSRNESIKDFIENRSLRFRKVADIIGETTKRLVLLSPFTYVLSNSMKEYLNRFSITPINRKIEYVNKEVVLISNSSQFVEFFKTPVRGYSKTTTIPKKVNLILKMLQEQKNIVYVSRYDTAYDIIDNLDWTRKIPTTDRYCRFISHLEKTYSIDNVNEWKIISALKQGIGIYISPLPRYIKREIINLYEQGVLGTLIVTTAFTEGVNTNAGNLIISSLVNGPNSNKLTDIDVLNVAGRAGRFAHQSIGKIFCLTEEVYAKVFELQREAQIRLDNYNYCKVDHNRIDYEIDMIQDEFLSITDEREKRQVDDRMIELGLQTSELDISLNVSKKWKIMLYSFFLHNESCVDQIYRASINLIQAKENEKVKALDQIFTIIKVAFDESGIEGFPCEPYDIRAFDSKGEFIWGRLYSVYCAGKISTVIARNRAFVTRTFDHFVEENMLQNVGKKSELAKLFRDEGIYWVLKYYKSDLSLNFEAFYSETFRFISSIIQYKIPFYVSFVVSVLRLFLSKNRSDYNVESLDVKKLALMFENGNVEEDYAKLIDFGIPSDMINRMSENGISIASIKANDIQSGLFDEYECMLLNDARELLL